MLAGSTHRLKSIPLEDASGTLDFPDVADDVLHFIVRDFRHRGHVSEDPVMLFDALGNSVAYAEVRVMAGFVYPVDQWRALIRACCSDSVAQGTVGVEHCFAGTGHV